MKTSPRSRAHSLALTMVACSILTFQRSRYAAQAFSHGFTRFHAGISISGSTRMNSSHLFSTSSATEALEEAIKAKGDEIRTLKATGATKAEVAPLVQDLLSLKAQLNPPEEKVEKPKQQPKQKQKQRKSNNQETMSESELRQTRLGKVQAMIDSGVEPYAYTYDCNTKAADLQAKYGPEESLQPGAEDADADVRIAGRIMAKREFGKLAFYTLQDETGTIQLYLEKKRLEGDNFKNLKAWADLGDYIGVRGSIRKTDKGEVSVFANGKFKWINYDFFY